jgi:hypothetical protein
MKSFITVLLLVFIARPLPAMLRGDFQLNKESVLTVPLRLAFAALLPGFREQKTVKSA